MSLALIPLFRYLHLNHPLSKVFMDPSTLIAPQKSFPTLGKEVLGYCKTRRLFNNLQLLRLSQLKWFIGKASFCSLFSNYPFQRIQYTCLMTWFILFLTSQLKGFIKRLPVAPYISNFQICICKDSIKGFIKRINFVPYVSISHVQGFTKRIHYKDSGCSLHFT